ncbi:MAG TPA: hypothetical protein VFX20_18260 [Steroidobacteraceae bacterium]|nr:hypothetical protein [Steroidobacteraceae bacterium]
MSTKPIQGKLEGVRLLDAEAWLRQRLIDHGVLERVPDLKHGVREVDLGVTTTAMRAERMRQLILRHGLEVVIAGGTRKGKPETYAELFERVYGEPVITDAMRAAAAELRRRKP